MDEVSHKLLLICDKIRKVTNQKCLETFIPIKGAILSY